MRKTLTAVLLLAAGLASAQTPKLDQDIRADRKEIRADKTAIRRDNAAQRAQIAGLNAQEKAAMDAVTADASLSKEAGNDAKRKIHADFKAKKDAIRVQMKAARKSKRADIQAERRDIRQDRQDRTGDKGK